ncbi:hypothetical protein GEV39_16360 [Pseudomonas sp. NY5710]|nr:hypothetical protein GEV39_16360 [Pseudomonas sp. NY5710]
MPRSDLIGASGFLLQADELAAFVEDTAHAPMILGQLKRWLYNVAERAIEPCVIGRRARLFIAVPKAAKVNGQELYAATLPT